MLSLPFRRRLSWVALVLAAYAALFFGWRELWFMTDDAYIAFRYVHNEIVGRGLVWNPPPFRPVEGYTSFLWVVVLDVVWRLFGVEPPSIANWLGLACGAGSLALTIKILARMTLPERFESYRVPLAATALLGILTNRTFLAWLSSGLETPLFNLLIMAWAYTLFASTARISPARLSAAALLASLLALTRPDGLLFCAATGTLILALSIHSRRRLVALVPLAIPVLHLLFRLQTYGAWLPNTYYAKHVGAWPESGLRYLGSFVLEYGLCVWLALCLVWGLRTITTRRLWSSFVENLPTIAVVSTLGVHVAYYTLVIGGDHFEYRVYSHLVPLLWTSTLALGVWAAPRPRETFLIMVACLGLALPIPWVHFARTQHLHSRAETFQLQVSVADAMPWPLGPVAEVWDEWQGWLIGHFVCMRHQEHKAFVQHQLGKYPSRWEGLEMSWDRRVVLVDRTVGVPGWNLPNIAIIDAHGLNDYVIARTPVTQRRERRMAHDRTAPKGYLGCLKPNARVRHGMLLVSERPLRDDEVVWCESAFLPPPLLNTPNDQK